ncbi:MAG: cobyrinate a,c-diamide synthase [Clostridia bacterium]|nr:cobyrinate a,c-diamide synthase [Clostridia bacterium]
MIQFLIAAPNSGAGKTMVVCALLRALQRRGFSPCAFKCGPDYIDPMFHRSAVGADSLNLDLFLSDENTVREIYAQGCAGHNASICEGVMGLYDGVGGITTQASAWHVADTLDLPVLLVVRPNGASLTLAAQINSLKNHRAQSHITGILLNRCSPVLCKNLSGMLERETGLPVLGCLPDLPEANVNSRHLGLYTAGEISDISARMDALADVLEQNVNIDRIIRITDRPAPKSSTVQKIRSSNVKIAVALDEAFCFIYPETLISLKNCGAEIIPFSPVHDSRLPDGIGGLYLPGGYPELYAGQLTDNRSMISSVYSAVKSGIPTVAECGGFLYLCKSLQDDNGISHDMVGLLPSVGIKTDRLTRFGYAHMSANTDSLLFKNGESIPVHEFHYWDSDDNGSGFSLRKPVSGRSWKSGFATDTLYAAFPHLYFAGSPQLAQRFVNAAEQYIKGIKE